MRRSTLLQVSRLILWSVIYITLLQTVYDHFVFIPLALKEVSIAAVFTVTTCGTKASPPLSLWTSPSVIHLYMILERQHVNRLRLGTFMNAPPSVSVNTPQSQGRLRGIHKHPPSLKSEIHKTKRSYGRSLLRVILLLRAVGMVSSP